MSRPAPPSAEEARLAGEKTALRRRMAALRDALPATVRAGRAGLLADRLDDPAFQALLPAPGGMVAGYHPIRSELDPLPLLERLAKAGFRRALPRVTPDGLVFHEWPEAEPPVPGAFGIPEPSPHWPIAAPDLFLTPLLAFDSGGGRLGYGRGHYDRLFAARPAARRVGIAYREQEVPAVPRGPWDARLDLVLAV
jgi:5-formyltetrahydrofolate cyclo-ligase